jgi:hypothetical protein
MPVSFPPAGAPNSWASFNAQADEEGISLSLRGRARRSAKGGDTRERPCVLRVVGPAGSTRQFYQELREATIRHKGTGKGLPRSDKVFVVPCDLSGVPDSAPPEFSLPLPEDDGSLTEAEDVAAAPAGSAGPGREAEPRPGDGASVASVEWPAEPAAAAGAPQPGLPDGMPDGIVELGRRALLRLQAPCE